MSLNEYEVLSAHRAVEGLGRTTGIRSSILADAGPKHDGQILIETSDGRTFDLPYDVKFTIDRKDQLLTFKTRHDTAVLITRELTRTMAEHCRELGIQFIDHAGNCFLRQPGLFVFVTGAKETTNFKQAAIRGLTPATLRVVFAILTIPSVLNCNVRRIAEVASISHGAAGAALITLEEAGFFSSAKSGRRMLTMPERWLDTWTEGYLGRIRPKLEKYKMSAPVALEAVLKRVSSQMGEVALGGEAAAAHLDMGLKPGVLTLYIDLKDPGVLRDLVQQLKLRRDPEGKIEMVDMFWNTQELPCMPTVPDALIYADLVGTGDNRAMEIAMRMRKKILDDVTNQA